LSLYPSKGTPEDSSGLYVPISCFQPFTLLAVGATVTSIEFGGAAHQWNQAAKSALDGKHASENE
jgi:hypothetical protein